MKNPFRSTFAALGLLAAATVGVSAQPALNVATVDMQRLYDGYYRAEASMAKLQEDDKLAKAKIDGMMKEREALVGEAKNLQEQSQSTMLNEDARKRAEADFQRKVEDVQKKEQELQQFAQSTQQRLQQRATRDQQMYFEEIVKVATEIAKKKGVTMLMNKGALGVVIYSDPGFDLTDEVMVVINKDRPTPAISLTPPAAK